MRNKIIILLVLLSILLLVISIFNGIKIGSFQILSVFKLKDKSEVLDEKIDTVSKLTSINYPQSIKSLEETYSRLNIQKQKYEELEGIIDNQENEIYETEKYDIDYLWLKLGKYASKHNLTIGIGVQRVSDVLYNLNFKVSGQYVDTSEFIADIENDSELNFRIYNFKMDGTAEIIATTFLVKNIKLDSSTLSL